MKFITAILLFISSVAFSQNVYYVATNGDAGNSGTISSPVTMQRAIEIAEPEDTVYIRGGVYYLDTPLEYNLLAYPSAIGNTGLPGQWITYKNYPGEDPIFDFSNVPPIPGTANGYRSGLYMNAINYVHMKGFTIRNLYQYRDNVQSIGINMFDSENIKMENITVHHVSGNAFRSFNGWLAPGSEPFTYPIHATFPGDTIWYINCDAYHCVDSFAINPEAGHTGGSGDGWKTSQEDGADGYPPSVMIWDGCRAWNCSDDGFDPSASNDAIVIMNNCWAFNNGALDGDGNGFKIAPGFASAGATPSKYITNCIAAGNFYYGFFLLEYPDYLRSYAMFWNNFSYDNLHGFNISRNDDQPTVLAEYRNNVSYDNRDYNWVTSYLTYTESHNSWNGNSSYPGYEDAYAMVDGYWLSVDINELDNARQADGSLPAVNFAKPSGTNPMVGQGLDVGMSEVPDIGIDWDWIDAGGVFEPDPEPDPDPSTGTTVKYGGKILKFNNKIIKL